MTGPEGAVLLSPDKFKGSADAVRVAQLLAEGIVRVVPAVPVTVLPVADGGEGTVDAAVAAGFTPEVVQVPGPLGDQVTARLARRGRTAVVEMAQASGLALLPAGVPAPLQAGTAGTGRLISAALDAGATTLVLGAGGSATTDGGAGMLAALGARLLDDDGRDLPPGGAALVRLARVDLSGLDRRLRRTQIVLASDVDSPLLGPDGAAHVYAPQKGADPEQVALLDSALARWVDTLAEELGNHAHKAASLPGAGAAGGLGYAALAVLGAVRRPGIDVLLDVLGFEEHVTGARLVVTGEGSLDEQSLRGKAPLGVARRAKSHGVPTVAVCGRSALPVHQVQAAGFHAVHALTDLEPDPARCITQVDTLLRRTGEHIGLTYVLAAD